ncbi:MAG: glycoside hydrolase family 1 protein [Chloroflexi bacterium]|nr:MAG: glycoside hydrolase family 1 protein [Chloroflexota bacterium]
MGKATFHFPRGFLWGTATSSHQVEGGCTNNNWYAWEQEQGRIIQGQKSGLACDWWGGRWREDLDRAAEAGQNAHRMSIEWSRIQPEPDRWDEHAIDRYRDILRRMFERNMTPLVTLHHFSDPIWIYEKGGWENPDTIVAFESFVRKVVEAFKEYASIWCTINEPNVYAVLGYTMGDFPPGKKDIKTTLNVLTNQIKGHAAAYRAIHAIQPRARVGPVIQYRGIAPKHGWFPLDSIVASLQSHMFNNLFPYAIRDGKVSFPVNLRLPEAKGTMDFLGINYYTKEYASFSLKNSSELFARRSYREGVEISDNGMIAVEPEGMFEALKWGLQFKVPLIVTENGIETQEDGLRRRYMVQHIHQVWRAVNFNWPVKGFFWWTLVDNFEWERGWTQRFGLWELDPESQVRRKRPSADLYAEIVRENGLSYEMVEKYAPEVIEKLFP